MRKGQISLWIFIGVIIISFVGITVFYTSKMYEKKDAARLATVEEERTIIGPAQSFAESCLRNLAEDGIFLIGFQGGIIYLPEQIPLIQTYYSKVPLWHMPNKQTVINEDFVKQELERYVNSYLGDCVTRLDMPGFQVNTQPTVSKVSLRETEVGVEALMNVELKRENFTYVLDKYTVVIPVRLKKILEQSKNTVDMLGHVRTGIDVTFLSKQEIPTTIFNFGENDRVFVLRDEESRVKNRAYQFMFAARLQSSNRPPLIEPIPQQTVAQGKEVIIQVKATDPDGDELTYSVISDVMRINNKGEIRFIARDKRTYSGVVQVKDPFGDTVFENVVVKVN